MKNKIYELSDFLLEDRFSNTGEIPSDDQYDVDFDEESYVKNKKNALRIYKKIKNNIDNGMDQYKYRLLVGDLFKEHPKKEYLYQFMRRSYKGQYKNGIPEDEERDSMLLYNFAKKLMKNVPKPPEIDKTTKVYDAVVRSFKEMGGHIERDQNEYDHFDSVVCTVDGKTYRVGISEPEYLTLENIASQLGIYRKPRDL